MWSVSSIRHVWNSIRFGHELLSRLCTFRNRVLVTIFVVWYWKITMSLFFSLFFNRTRKFTNRWSNRIEQLCHSVLIYEFLHKANYSRWNTSLFLLNNMRDKHHRVLTWVFSIHQLVDLNEYVIDITLEFIKRKMIFSPVCPSTKIEIPWKRLLLRSFCFALVTRSLSNCSSNLRFFA